VKTKQEQIGRLALTEELSMLIEIDRFLRRTGMPPTRFGRLAVRDPRLVGDLKRGRVPGPRVCARIAAFIEMHRAPHEEPRS
jgi:hypothetical protein